ncbi:MAG: hypothetical protein HKN20_01535, partial [Gemmatimonadetes bacterium]|nr:hypothetical protein [Gemmatimonadota bacterium]
VNWLRNRSILGLVLVLSLTLWGCGDDNNPSDPGDGGGSSETAPDLPPTASFTFDASDVAFFEASSKTATNLHWFNAATRVAIVWGVASLSVAIPAALFAGVINADPQPARQSDGSWIWSHTTSNGALQSQVIGDPGDGMVEWTFRTIANPTSENAETRTWFVGTTSGGGSSATWTFFAADREGAPAVAQIDYDETETGKTLSFTDLYEETEGGGTIDDALTFTVDGDARSIEFVDGQSDDIWFIEWNESTQTGSIQVPEYNDGEKGCWDELLEDVDCPIAAIQ